MAAPPGGAIGWLRYEKAKGKVSCVLEIIFVDFNNIPAHFISAILRGGTKVGTSDRMKNEHFSEPLKSYRKPFNVRSAGLGNSQPEFVCANESVRIEKDVAIPAGVVEPKAKPIGPHIQDRPDLVLRKITGFQQLR